MQTKVKARFKRWCKLTPEKSQSAVHCKLNTLDSTRPDFLQTNSRSRGFGHKANACSQETRCIRCGGNHKLAECTVPRDNPKCANCNGNYAASYKGCSKYQDELSANRPLTVRDLPEILATAIQSVADAVIQAKTTRYTDFDLSEFRQDCKDRQDHHNSNLLRKLLKVPPEPNEQDDQNCDMPPNE